MVLKDTREDGIVHKGDLGLSLLMLHRFQVRVGSCLLCLLGVERLPGSLFRLSGPLLGSAGVHYRLLFSHVLLVDGHLIVCHLDQVTELLQLL